MSKGSRSPSPRFLATRCLSWIAAALVVCGLAAAAQAAAGEWPQRTVRIITGPLAPGSSIDATAHIIGDELAKKWKHPVTIDNRPGADCIIAGQAFLLAVIATLANIGMAAHGNTPAAFAAILDEQRAKWAAIARDHGINPEHD